MITKNRIKKKRNTGKICSDNEEETEENNKNSIKQINNRVFFYSEVTKDSVLSLLENLEKAASCAVQTCFHPNAARVHLYIHSGGGDVYAGFSAMDHIRNCRVPVITIADGYVASAATFMLLGGYKRYGLLNTNILIHQLSAEFWGKFSELEFEIVNTRKVMNMIRNIYEKNTKLSGDQLDNMLNSELVLTSEESITHGFISKIV